MSMVIFLLPLIASLLDAYPSTKCPDMSQYRLQERAVCLKDLVYTCFHNCQECINDTEDKDVKEICMSKEKIDFVPPGQKIVWTGNIRNLHCSKDRFQPSILFFNISNKCLLEKSHCNEEGQLQYDDGTSTENRKCTCDFKKGYNFISKPKNECYCIEPEEDCSCVMKPCQYHNESFSGTACSKKAQMKCQMPLNTRDIPSINSETERIANYSFPGKIQQKREGIEWITGAIASFGIFVCLVLGRVVFKKKDTDTLPEVYVESPTVEGHAGSLVTLEFYVISSEESILSSIEWIFRKESREYIIDLKNSKYAKHDAFLTIKNLTQDDTGEYKCMATDQFGTSGSPWISLEIKINKPEVYILQPKYCCKAASSVKLDCNVCSPCCEVTSVEWIFTQETYEKVIDISCNSKKYSFESCHNGNLTTFSLTIFDLSPADEGEYKCRVKNKIGTGSSTPTQLVVKVNKKPNLLFNSSSYSCNAGEALTLTCCAITQKCTTQKFEWTFKRRKEEKNIDTSANTSKYRNGTIDNPSLTILCTKPSDSGRYICKATNAAGTTAKSLVVTIVGAAPIIIVTSNAYILDSWKKTTLVCMVIADPVPSASGIFFSKIANGNSQKINPTKILKSEEHAFFLCLLETEEPGDYRCHAINSLGKENSEVMAVKIACEFGDNVKIIAALDVGSTNSKCAFILLEDSKTVYTSSMEGSKLKEPTCLLINENEKSVLFGIPAETRYKEMIEMQDKDRENYGFYQEFISNLDEKKSLENISIKDTSGIYEKSALDIFSQIICALKEITINELRARKMYIDTDENRISWVISLPSNWNKKEENFFIKCSEKAGIKRQRLLFAKESIAIKFACKNFPATFKPEDTQLFDNSRYIVIDIGGSRCKMSANLRKDEYQIAEEASKILPIGEGRLNSVILELFESLVGKSVMEALKKEEKDIFIHWLKTFQSVKRKITGKNVDFDIPIDILNRLCERYLKKTFREALNESDEKINIRLIGKKVFVRKERFQKLLDKVSTDIGTKIKEFIDSLKHKTVSAILIVGGFSKFHRVKDSIQKLFSAMKIFDTDEPEFAVVKGSVLFGCKPNVINTRVTEYTYGRRIRPMFRKDVHDIKKRVTNNLCKDVFETILGKDEFVPIGKLVKLTYKTQYKKQDSINVAIYISRQDNPMYVDEEGCKKIFERQILIQDPTNENRFVDVDLMFEHSEIMLKCTERKFKTEKCFAVPLLQ